MTTHLKPWREIAEFAADLSRVHAGTANEEYQNPTLPSGLKVCYGLNSAKISLDSRHDVDTPDDLATVYGLGHIRDYPGYQNRADNIQHLVGYRHILACVARSRRLAVHKRVRQKIN